MKNAMHWLWAGIVVVAAVGCAKIDKILPRNEGRWDITNLNTITYVDDSLTANVNQTDSLGTYFFDDNGIGYLEDFLGDRTDFIWEVNEENDWVTLTDTAGSPTVYQVVESSSKEQVWTTSLYNEIQGVVTKRDLTATMQRAD